MVYEINKYGKIVVNEKEVYYGCIIQLDLPSRVAKLLVIDWRDKNIQGIDYQKMDAPFEAFTIKYDNDDDKGEF
jgi:hypothetical protein